MSPIDIRIGNINRFYELLAMLKSRNGLRQLDDCDGRMCWPQRGVYFFFENGELRTTRTNEPRVVRVGTHAVSLGSKTTIWNRLSQHRGTLSLGGNHRGSIFRLLVGKALAARNPALATSQWGQGQSAPKNIRDAERELEIEVSKHIRSMPFTWMSIDDEPSKESKRAYVERNCIALLSNARDAGRLVDSPSQGWLGHHCPHTDVRRSSLWNCRHIDEDCDPGVLDEIERYVCLPV